MKSFFFILPFILIMPDAHTQTVYYGAGDNKLHAGYALDGYGRGFQASYDYGINEFVSVGGGGQYYYKPFPDATPYFIFVRSDFHVSSVLPLPSWCDLYIGLRVNYFVNRIYGGIGGGMRVRFTDNIGLFFDFAHISGVGLYFSWGGDR